jgi:AP2 domain
MNRLHHISRVDHEASRTHAWFVRVRRCYCNARKVFSDGVLGGKRKALKAAIEYRDALLNSLTSSDHEIWTRTRVRRNNRSGTAGVARYERPANPTTGHRQTYWAASWVDENGASRARKFSVSVYGERQAERLARAERERQLQRVCDIKASRGHRPFN